MQNNLTRWDYFWLIFFLFIGFIYQYGSFPIENINEGLYAQIPREMLATGNYIIPHLNGVPYLEKPPLLYWLTTIAYHLFGVNPWTARCIPILSAIGICFSLLWFGKTQNASRVGWLAAIILSSSIGFILIARVLIFDMLLTFCLSLTLLFFYRWYQTEKRGQILWAYVFLALAFLTKGLVAVAFTALISMIFMAIDKAPKEKWLQLFDGIGIIIFLAIVSPWIIIASAQQNYFFSDFFINEQVMRFLNKRIPDDYHSGPLYYYIPRLIVYLLPWSIFYPLLLKKYSVSPLSKFLYCWIIVPFLFFSLSGDKGDYYLVLIVPALAYLIAEKIQEYFTKQNSKILNRCFVILISLEIPFFWLAYLLSFTRFLSSQFSIDNTLPHGVKSAALAVLAISSLYGLLGIVLIKLKKATPQISFLLMAGLVAPLVYLYVMVKHDFINDHSMIKFTRYMQTHDANRKLFLYRSYEDISSIGFYWDNRLPVIDSESDDLYFGSSTPEAKGWFLTANDLAKTCQQENCYVIVPKNRLKLFKEASQNIPFCIIHQNARNVLLTNDLAHQACIASP